MRAFASIVLVALVGCGVAESRPAPARVARVAPAPERPDCRVEAARAEDVTVELEGRPPFSVAVSDGLLWLVPTDDERALRVEARQPLRFSARARVDEQRLVAVVEADAAAGVVRLVPGLGVLGLRQGEQGGLAAYVKLGRRSPLAVRGVELRVGPVSLPCGGVRAEHDPEPRSSTSLLRDVPEGELRVAASAPLVVRPVRAAPAHVEVRPVERSGLVPAWVVDERGDDARIVVAFSDGARIEGWVSASALREPTTDEAEAVERIVRERAGDPFGLAMLGGGHTPEVAAQPDEYVGLASLRPGAAIFVQPGEGRWAASSESPTEVRVRWQRGARHAELLAIPGLWAPPGHAFVRRDEIAIPEP